MTASMPGAAAPAKPKTTLAAPIPTQPTITADGSTLPIASGSVIKPAGPGVSVVASNVGPARSGSTSSGLPGPASTTGPSAPPKAVPEPSAGEAIGLGCILLALAALIASRRKAVRRS